MSLIQTVMIQSPCTANWSDMTGDEQSRHCGQCNLSVFNLSAMTTQEAEALLAQNTTGRLCVRYYQRPDGTVMTADCSAIRARQHRRARLLHKGVAASVLFLTLAGSLMVQRAFAEAVSPAVMGAPMMGDRAIAAPTDPQPVIMGGIRPMAVPPTLVEGNPEQKPKSTSLVSCKKEKCKHPKPDTRPVIMGKMAPPKR